MPSARVNAETAAPKTVLLVDDTDTSRIATKWFLNTFGFTVDTARNAEEALALFDPETHDLILTDNSMLGMTGSEMAHVIKLRSNSTPILMYTGSVPEDRSCVDLMLEKPSHMLVLKEAVDQLLATRK